MTLAAFLSLDLYRLLDIIASVAFAATGALVASRKQLDLLGFCWLAVLTGIGGGTVRDLLLDVPVFWVRQPVAVYVCLLTALVVYFTAPVLEYRYRYILWFDAFGMALVTVVGAAKGVEAGVPAIVAVVMGVITASVGGILRDTIGREPSIILKREIYVTASALGASLYVVLATSGLDVTMSYALSFLLAFCIRGLAIVFDLHMPLYRPRPGRDYSEPSND